VIGSLVASPANWKILGVQKENVEPIN
jgi:hypothetical protein